MVRTEFPKLGTAIQVKHVTKFTVQCSTVRSAQSGSKQRQGPPCTLGENDLTCDN
jgi:hypothetical protein